jgi:hypothetical protein
VLRKAHRMATSKPIRPPGAPDAPGPPSRAYEVEEDATLAGLAAAVALAAIEIAAIVVLGLLVVPPLAILVVVVVAPLLVIGLVVALLAAVLTVRTSWSSAYGATMEATRRFWRTASAWPVERSWISRRTGSTPPPVNSTPAGDRNAIPRMRHRRVTTRGSGRSSLV